MENIILWASVGIFALSVIIGLCAGLLRGVKRSATHFAFLIASLLAAFFLTKTITGAILGLTLPIDDGNYTISDYILYIINKQFNISSFESAQSFIKNLPSAIASPIVFILLSLVFMAIFEIAYLITARVAFGKKKNDFKEHKPYRAYGGVVGILEGIIVVVLLFAPLSSLAGTYKTLAQTSEASAVATTTENNGSTDSLQTIGQIIKDSVPEAVDTALISWDKSVLGKLTGAFGLDNLMFDYLSDCKVDGESIKLRSELTSAATAYNDFVNVYNLAKSGDYTKINFAKLKSSVGKVMDGNLFKTVVADSIQTFVVKYQQLKQDLSLNLPTIADDVLTELYNSFSKPNFDVNTYLKHDASRLIDAFNIVFSNDLVTKYNSLENKDFSSILSFVSENNSAINNLAENVVSLNLVSDSFSVLIKTASEKVDEMFSASEGDESEKLEIKLNENIEDKEATIRALLDIVDDLSDVGNKINISNLISGDDIVSALTDGVDNVGATLEKLGATFDKIRNLDLLKLTNEENGEITYVFDNILKSKNIELLGDEVYLTSKATEKTKLDTYTLFFSYVGGALDCANDLGLTDFGKDGVSFDNILDRVLLALETEDDDPDADSILTRTITPFYQLKVMNLNEKVFDTVVDNLKNNISLDDDTSMLNFDIENADYFTWVEQFNGIAKMLKLLNSGKGKIENFDGTYLKYLMTDGSDLETAMKAMLNDNALGDILDVAFSFEVFEPLKKDIFDTLDSEVKEMTGTSDIEISTNLDNLADTKENVISTIKSVLSLILSDEDLTISDYGEILNLFKENAYNSGEKNGVFKNIFENLVWYMTGEDLTDEEIYAGLEPHENAADIKAYINTEDYYAENIDYKKLFAEIEDVVNLSEKLDKISFTITTDNTLDNIMDGIADALEGLDGTQKVSVVENMSTLLKNEKKNLLTSDQRANASDIENAIDDKFSAELAANLKTLLLSDNEAN